MSNRKRLNVAASAAVASMVGAWLAPQALQAATYTWNGATSGTLDWNVPTNWTPEGVPNAVGDVANLTIDWTGAATGVTIGTGAFSPTVGILNIDDTGASSDRAVSVATGTLVFDNGTSNAQLNGSGGSNVIVSPIQLNSNLAVSITSAMTLNAVSGAGGIIKTGSSTLTLNSTQSFAGDVDIQEGTITVDYGSRALPAAASVNIASGASFNIRQTNSNQRVIGGLSGAGSLTAFDGGGKNLTLNSVEDALFAGTIAYGNSGANTNNLIKTGSGNFTLGGSGLWSVGTSGGTTLELRQGKISLDNTATNVANRITDSVRLTHNGGELELKGNASLASGEAIGLHTVATRRVSTITLIPGSGQSASVTLSSLAQNAGVTTSDQRTTPGAMLYRGTGLGGTPGSANTSNVFYTTEPTGLLVGGGGAADTASLSILPFALGDTSATGKGAGLVTYDSTNGIRLLNTTTEFTDVATATATENAKLAAGTAVNATAVNSLLVTGNGTSALTGTLTVASGAIVFSGSGATSISGGTLQVGTTVATNGYVSVTDAAGVVTLGGLTYGTGGSVSLVKQGAGTLVLGGQAGSSSAYVVAAGTLRAGATNALFRNTTSVGEVLVVQNGATADMAGFNQTVNSNGYVTFDFGSTLTNTGANATFALAGNNTTRNLNFAGTVTDGTPGNGATDGLVSLNIGGGTSTQVTVNLLHGGHTVNHLDTVSNTNHNKHLVLYNLTSTDSNTVHGTVTIGNRGLITAITTANNDTSAVAKSLGDATINMIGHATAAHVPALTILSRAEGGSANGNALTSANTLAWTNNVNVSTVSTSGNQASFTVGARATTTDNTSNVGATGILLPADTLSSGVTQQLGGLTVNGLASQINVTANNNYTLQFTGATTLAHTAATDQTFSVSAGTLLLGAIGESGTGAKGLIKSGVGTMLVNGTAGYTGATSVAAGTFGGSGNLSTSSGLNVAAAATVTAGRAGGLGTLASSTLNLSSGSNLLADFKATSADKLTVTGGVSLDGANLVLGNLDNLSGPLNQTFVLIDNDDTDAVNGSFAGMTRDGNDAYAFNNGAGLAFTVYYAYDSTNSLTTGGNDVAIGFTSVPEPGTLSLLGLAGMGLLRRKRRAV